MFQKRDTEDVFGISDFTICSLHCKQRITEYLLRMIILDDKGLGDKLVRVKKDNIVNVSGVWDLWHEIVQQCLVCFLLMIVRDKIASFLDN